MHHDRRGNHKYRGGFTLVEVLVALAIFSLAALALLRLQGSAMATSTQLAARNLAGITLRNQAIEAMIAVPAPAFGTAQGDLTNGGRRWHWVQRTLRTADPRQQRIDITVTGNDGAAVSTIVVRSAS